jgi:hypothetical protein
MLGSTHSAPGLVHIDENTNGRRNASFAATACPRRAAHHYGLVLTYLIPGNIPRIDRIIFAMPPFEIIFIIF